MNYTKSQLSETFIDDVVKYLAHNEPLTCATEASDYVDAYSERQREYESRTRDWFHTTIEFERSIQVSLQTLLEKIAHIDDPATKQLNESHRTIKSRFDDIKSALKPLLHAPLTTPPAPSVMGAQLTQLAAKVNATGDLLDDTSRSAVRAKDAISKLEMALIALQTFPARPHAPSRSMPEDEAQECSFYLANARQTYSTSCEEYKKLMQDSTSMTERILANHSIIDSLVYVLHQRARTDCNHPSSIPTLACELGRVVTGSILQGGPLVVSEFETYRWARQWINTLAVSLSLLTSMTRRAFCVSPSQSKQPYPPAVVIGLSSIGFLVVLIAFLRQSEDGMGYGPPEGHSVPLHPIWDSLLASGFDSFDETATRMIPTGVA